MRKVIRYYHFSYSNILNIYFMNPISLYFANTVEYILNFYIPSYQEDKKIKWISDTHVEIENADQQKCNQEIYKLLDEMLDKHIQYKGNDG